MSKLKQMTKETIEEAVKSSKSFANVLKILDLSVDSGSATKSIKKLILKLNIDISHFTGQLWSKGITLGPKQTLEEWLKSKNISHSKLRKRILNEKVFPLECNDCKNSMWLGIPIWLELNYIDR